MPTQMILLFPYRIELRPAYGALLFMILLHVLALSVLFAAEPVWGWRFIWGLVVMVSSTQTIRSEYKKNHLTFWLREDGSLLWQMKGQTGRDALILHCTDFGWGVWLRLDFSGEDISRSTQWRRQTVMMLLPENLVPSKGSGEISPWSGLRIWLQHKAGNACLDL